MAELLKRPALIKVELGGIKIEQQADGTVLIFVPPESYNVMTTVGGFETSQSGRLYSQVVIAPRLADPAAASRETQLGLGEKQ